MASFRYEERRKHDWVKSGFEGHCRNRPLLPDRWIRVSDGNRFFWTRLRLQSSMQNQPRLWFCGAQAQQGLVQNRIQQFVDFFQKAFSDHLFPPLKRNCECAKWFIELNRINAQFKLNLKNDTKEHCRWSEIRPLSITVWTPHSAHKSKTSYG